MDKPGRSGGTLVDPSDEPLLVRKGDLRLSVRWHLPDHGMGGARPNRSRDSVDRALLGPAAESLPHSCPPRNRSAAPQRLRSPISFGARAPRHHRRWGRQKGPRADGGQRNLERNRTRNRTRSRSRNRILSSSPTTRTGLASRRRRAVTCLLPSRGKFAEVHKAVA